MAEPVKYEDVDTQLLRDYPELAPLIEKNDAGLTFLCPAEGCSTYICDEPWCECQDHTCPDE